jgi:hypothetical protein
MQAAEADTRNMKPLVALVIIMGVLIVTGIVVIVVTITSRMGGGRTASSPAATVTQFAAVDLPVPAGCQVMETTTANDRLILRLGTGERCNQVLIVDISTGKLLGTLRLVPNGQ